MTPFNSSNKLFPPEKEGTSPQGILLPHLFFFLLVLMHSIKFYLHVKF